MITRWTSAFWCIIRKVKKKHSRARNTITNTSTIAETRRNALPPIPSRRWLPPVIALAMMGAFLVTGAVLPLYGLLFHTALLTQLGQWVLLPTHLLFPGWTLTPTLVSGSDGPPPSIALSWQQVPLLLAGFLLTLICYLAALRYLPQHIDRRYILCSTLLIGLVCVLIPVVTSQDIFSYIIYARMAIVYGLNPLTALPTAIHADPVFQHLYWKDQPSAYGPTWVYISGLLQLLVSGTNSIVAMVLALRLLSLLAHLWSILLIWSIGGHLQHRFDGHISQQQRILATLAFAWNPLLLFEACVNAHNDSVLLLLVLFALWFLVRTTPTGRLRTYLPTAIMLALATCLKINIILLIPGLLLFLWAQPGRLRATSTTLLVYGATILLLYAPFWQNGALLDILHINPATYRNINNLPEFLSHFYNSIAQLLGASAAPEIGSPAESLLHTASIVIFVIIYALSCWRALGLRLFPIRRVAPLARAALKDDLTAPGHPCGTGNDPGAYVINTENGLNTPLRLIRWMAFIWLLYCAIGTPWTWPWYTVTFFGLFALSEAADRNEWQKHSYLHIPLAVPLLAFSMLSLYCFFTWGPFASFVPWLPGFRWAFWRGLWGWLIPGLALLPRALQKKQG